MSEEVNPNPWHDKLVITGTGRSGTTFLMQLLTAMNEDTGYGTPTATIQQDANAGMERVNTWSMTDDAVRALPRILKDPRLCLHLEEICARGHIPGHVVWCFRPIDMVAKSRFECNRPWFPDDSLPDLHKVPRNKWPKWATLENQTRAMAEVLGRLTSTLLRYEIKHTVIIFPGDMMNPNQLWRSFVGQMRRGSVAEYLNWRTKDDLERFERAFFTVVNPDLVHFGRPVAWDCKHPEDGWVVPEGETTPVMCSACGVDVTDRAAGRK